MDDKLKKDKRVMLIPPDFKSLPSDLCCALSILSSRDVLCKLDGNMIKNLTCSELSILKDPLSDAFEALHGAPDKQDRPESESEALTWWLQSGRATESFRNFKLFKSSVSRLATYITGHSPAWRNGPIYLKVDVTEILVEFLDLSEIRPSIERALLFYNRADRDEKLYAALCLYIVFLNSHPLRDGNGRTARIILNLCLQNMGAPKENYVPFIDFFVRSSGGYQIAVRRAETQNDWLPFLWYFANVINLCLGGGVWKKCI